MDLHKLNELYTKTKKTGKGALIGLAGLTAMTGLPQNASAQQAGNNTSQRITADSSQTDTTRADTTKTDSTAQQNFLEQFKEHYRSQAKQGEITEEQKEKAIETLEDCEDDPKGPFNILKDQLQSREVLTTQNYGIPTTVGQDTIAIDDLEGADVTAVSTREGEDLLFEYKQGNEWKRANLSNLEEGEELPLPDNRKIENIGGKLNYVTDETTTEGVRTPTLLTRGEDGGDATRFVTAHFSDYNLEDITNLQKQINSLNSELEEALNERNRAMKLAERKDEQLDNAYDKLDETEEELEGYQAKWALMDLSPTGGFASNTEGNASYLFGLEGSLPVGIAERVDGEIEGNGITLGLYRQGSLGQEALGTESDTEIDKPDEPRPGMEDIESFRETTTERTQTSSNATLGAIEFPLTTEASLGAVVGYETADIEEVITDRSGKRRNGQEYDIQQDQKIKTMEENSLRTGIQASYDFGKLDVGVRLDTDPMEPEDLQGAVTIGYNLVN